MRAVDICREIELAEPRVRGYVLETVCEPSPMLGTSVWCKLENLQHTGSFKVRGAASKVLSLTAQDRARGVVTASSGNAGAAVAFVLGRLDAQGLVFLPENADPSKVANIERLGARVQRFSSDVAETEAHARAYAARHAMTYVPPYNDPQVIGGQGTIACELARQLEHIDAVLVTVGGGGLISGIGSYFKVTSPDTRIIGCWPENSDVMKQSMEAGRILDLPSLPTLSDGSDGGVETDAITFDLCCEVIDQCITVTEAEIALAMRDFFATHHMQIEGAAGVAVASWRKIRERCVGANVVIVICGGNIDSAKLERVLAGEFER